MLFFLFSQSLLHGRKAKTVKRWSKESRIYDLHTSRVCAVYSNMTGSAQLSCRNHDSVGLVLV